MMVQTERLTLRPLTLKLAQAAASRDIPLLEALLEASVPPQWPLPDLGAFLPQWVRMLEGDPDLARWGVWLVIHRDQMRLIGDAGFQGRPGRGRTLELGCGILPAYRCMGYGSEAARGLIEWATELAPIYTIFAECGPGDVAARRMLGRLGFEPTEGRPGQELWRRQF